MTASPLALAVVVEIVNIWRSMSAVKPLAGALGTLGDVLYPDKHTPVPSEGDWVALVHAIAAGDQAALHGLYERASRPVFTLVMRLTGSRETAEELTVDVFHDVWKRASAYDPANGTVLGWIMNQARSRAIDRVRFDHRQKRTRPEGEALGRSSVDAQEALEPMESRQQLQQALDTLSPAEREAIEGAFFGDSTNAEVATRLQQPLGTIKTRIRTGLDKLRSALTLKSEKP